MAFKFKFLSLSQVYYIELNYLEKTSLQGMVVTYNGPDTSGGWQLIPPKALMTGITNDLKVSNFQYDFW